MDKTSRKGLSVSTLQRLGASLFMAGWALASIAIGFSDGLWSGVLFFSILGGISGLGCLYWAFTQAKAEALGSEAPPTTLNVVSLGKRQRW